MSNLSWFNVGTGCNEASQWRIPADKPWLANLTLNSASGTLNFSQNMSYRCDGNTDSAFTSNTVHTATCGGVLGWFSSAFTATCIPRGYILKSSNYTSSPMYAAYLCNNLSLPYVKNMADIPAIGSLLANATETSAPLGNTLRRFVLSWTA